MIKRIKFEGKKSFKTNTKAGRKLKLVMSGIFGKSFLANSQNCLMSNETNCKQKK